MSHILPAKQVYLVASGDLRASANEACWPGGIAIQVKTGADGTYKFTGLAPGTYDLSTAGQPPQLVIVGPDGTLGGKLMKGTDGVVKLSCATGNHIKAK